MLEKVTLDLMESLTCEIGVAGNEERVSKLLSKYYKDFCDEIIFDNLGSTFAVKRSKKDNAKKVMICAHMDEIGFIAKEIKKDGTIKLLPLGNFEIGEMINSRAVALNEVGERIEGVISLINKEKKADKDNIGLDIGAESKIEVLNYKIDIGSEIVLKGEFSRLLGGKKILSKAWDNRFGCILGVEVLRELKDVELDFHLFVGGSVQNHVGLRGSITSTNLIKPDLAIVTDCLEAKEKDEEGRLGEGLLVSFYDKSMMPNKTLLKYLINTCEEKKVSYQHYYSLDESDGGWIHKLLDGCPTLKLCIPARNIKSCSSMIDMRDYVSSKRALVEILKKLKEEEIELFKMENR
ncbi:MAG: M42 family metallopeptidase [Clostridium sp.]